MFCLPIEQKHIYDDVFLCFCKLMHNWVFLSLFTCIMKMKYMATCIIHIQDLVEGSEVIVLIVLWTKTTLSFILLPALLLDLPSESEGKNLVHFIQCHCPLNMKAKLPTAGNFSLKQSVSTSRLVTLKV